MVGVPGRSKGCNNCRKRKKACSLAKPVCYECQKAGRNCSYDRDLIFIVNEDSEQHRNPSYRATAKNEGNSETLVGVQASKSISTVLPLGTDALCNASFRQQLMSTFLLMHAQDPKSQNRSAMHWLSFVPSLPSPLKALETSTYALCTARLGQLQNNQVLIKESLRLYGKGLRELRLALDDPKLVCKDETLGACLALSLYEIVEGTRASYINHADGAAKLIKLRGPASCSSGFGHKIFLAFRFMGVLRAMEKKENSFLAEPEWMQCPWETMPKNPFDRLVDLILQAPNLLRGGERIATAAPGVQLMMVNELLRDCLQLDRNLEAFNESLTKENGSSLYWPVFASEDEIEKTPVRYEFANVNIAATATMMWAFSLMLRSGLCWLFAFLDQLSKQPPSNEVLSKALELGQQSNMATLARNILLSVDYCVRDDPGGVRATAIMAPLGIVIDILRGWPHCQTEYQSARQALYGVSKLGFRMVWPPVGEAGPQD